MKMTTVYTCKACNQPYATPKQLDEHYCLVATQMPVSVSVPDEYITPVVNSVVIELPTAEPEPEVTGGGGESAGAGATSSFDAPPEAA
jgi:hypothetical protein